MTDSRKTKAQLIDELQTLRARVALLEAESDKERSAGPLMDLEQFYRLAPIGLCLMDADLRFVHINEELARINGKPVSEHIGRRLRDVIPKLADQVEPISRRVVETGEPLLGYEVRGTTPGNPDGECVWLVNYDPVKAQDGTVQGVTVVVQDITNQKHIEERLAESEERFRRAVVHAPIPMIIHAEDGEVVQINDAWTEVTGYRHDEIATIADWTRRAHGTKQQQARDLIDGLYEIDHRVHEGEFTIRTKSGETRTCDFCSAPLGRLPDGRRLVMSMATDVTARKRAEDALRNAHSRLEERVAARTAELTEANRSLQYQIAERRRAETTLRGAEEQFRQLAENLREVLYLFDVRTRRVLYVNPAYEQVWGRPRKYLLEKTDDWMENVHVDDRRRIAQVWTTTAKLSRCNEEYRICRPDGSVRWIWDRTVPIRDATGDLSRIVGIAEDITRRKQAEQELKQAHDELEARVRERTAALAAANIQLRGLASELSLAEERERRQLATELHDGLDQHLSLTQIKLSAIRGLVKGTAAEQPLRDVERLIDEASVQARSLTFELSPPILYDIGLAAAVRWLAERLESQSGVGIKVVGDNGVDALAIESRILLFRTVRELLMNVIKHAGAKRASVSIRTRKDNLSIAVEDDGIGFDPAAAAAAGNGTGYGLFSIRERLSVMGSGMEVDSSPGRGARITVSVPLTEKLGSS